MIWCNTIAFSRCSVILEWSVIDAARRMRNSRAQRKINLEDILDGLNLVA